MHLADMSRRACERNMEQANEINTSSAKKSNKKFNGDCAYCEIHWEINGIQIILKL
jgi:hypothetical protein